MTQTSVLTGGHLKDLPKPHVRMWPDTTGHGLKRNLGFQVSQCEISVVRHYHVSWEQEDNPLQDLRTHAEASPEWKEVQGTEYGNTVIGWRCCWDDDERKGIRGHDFESTLKLQAVDVVLKVAAQFPDHEISVNYMKLETWLDEMDVTGPDRYYYKREGA